MRSIYLFLGIVFYALGIAERFLNLGILNSLYSIFEPTTIFYILIIVGSAFFISYLVERVRKPKGYFIAIGRRKPTHTFMRNPVKGEIFGVIWHLFPPDVFHYDQQPWADGPYCPKDMRELDEKTKGRWMFKKLIWECPLCGAEYPRPEGDVKDRVEKDFAAELRKRKGY